MKPQNWGGLVFITFGFFSHLKSCNHYFGLCLARVFLKIKINKKGFSL